MTASANSAARAPSTTRWSNVTAIVPVRRTTTSPSRTTGRWPMRPMLRIATSGWFTIGVWKRPASFPALVDGEGRAAQLVRRRASRRGRPPRDGGSRRRAPRPRSCPRRARRERRGPARSERRRRCRSGRGRRSRRPRAARSARETPASDVAAAFTTVARSRSSSTFSKSHSSTQVTGRDLRGARGSCARRSSAPDAAQRLAPPFAPRLRAGRPQRARRPR